MRMPILDRVITLFKAAGRLRLLSAPRHGAVPLLGIYLIGVVLSVPALAQSPSSLPPQAKSIQEVIMPVPKEIFTSLDQFHDVNWRAVQRPEIARWKSHGDQAQIATLLGVVIGEGFVAMEAKDSAEMKRLGASVLKLSRALGVQETVLRRSKSIIEFADHGDWTGARHEWNQVLSDLEAGMVQLKSTRLAQLVSIGGWLRGSEALSTLLLQRYSAGQAELLRQPVLLENLENQLDSMEGRWRRNKMVIEMLAGMKKIRATLPADDQPISEAAVKQIHDVCARLIQLSSQRPA